MQYLRRTPVVVVLAALVQPAGADVSPEQAIEAVAQFTKQAPGALVVRGVERTEGPGRHGPMYEVGLRDDPGTQVVYRVRMRDGVVTEFHDTRLEDCPDDGYSPELGQKRLPLDVEEAERIAAAFAAEHYAPFRSRRWQLWFHPLDPEPTSQYLWEDTFAWHEVLSDAGTLAPWPLEVSVSGYTGRVVYYRIPPGTISTCVRPLVGRSQAIAAVRQWLRRGDACRWEDTWLQVLEDVLGIQRLIWFVPLRGPVAHGAVVSVDAITGELLSVSWPMGGARDADVPPLPQGRTRVSVRVHDSSSRGIGSLVRPIVEGRVLWIRAEHLRAVDGVRVDVDRAGVTVRRGDSVVNGKELGAEWRDYGWWVPLRRAARALGWRVEWNGVRKEAVIHPDG